MKRSAGFAVAGMLAGMTAMPVLADQPGSDWISMDQARSALMAAGYSSITKIEADDGHWEGEGMKNGQKHEFHVNPHTGAITKDEVDR
jgi:hypothetical protein